jgi:hypothetical protein
MASGFVSPKKQLIGSKKLSIANADALTAKMASIFSSIEDPRVERTRVHLLTDILITAIPALLELLDIAGCIITIDAMGTLSCDRIPNF